MNLRCASATSLESTGFHPPYTAQIDNDYFKESYKTFDELDFIGELTETLRESRDHAIAGFVLFLLFFVRFVFFVKWGKERRNAIHVHPDTSSISESAKITWFEGVKVG